MKFYCYRHSIRCAVFLLLCLLPGPWLLLQAQEQAYEPGELIIMLARGRKLSDFRVEFGLLENEQQLSVTPLSPSVPVYLLRHPQFAGRETELRNRLNGLSTLYAAQLNYLVTQRLVPNDTGYTSQWALHNTGQTGGTADADVDAPEAWDITTGGLTPAGDTIVVAIVDGGFQLNHPDLSANIWINRAEIPGNGIDDDGNGYIDDINGWDAYDNDGTIPVLQHGTHVAGIVGARGNNLTGVSGINWKVKLMCIAGSSGNTATVISAYSYALEQRRRYNATGGEQGAFVVATNSSFGVNFGQPSNYPLWCAFYDTLGAAGILSVAATANAATNVDVQGDIPTACTSDFLVTVTNSTHTDVKNSGAAYGAISIDLAAPGTNIYSTVTGSNYANLTGTSMATPMVSGIIGLMYAYPCAQLGSLMHADPPAFALMIKEALLQGVDAKPAFAANTVSGGRVNARNALNSIALACSVPLAVRFLDFDAKVQNCRVMLRWQVAGNPADLFQVEGSVDGRSYALIGEVYGAEVRTGRYSYEAAHTAYRFFRVRIRDADGSSSYSAVREVAAAGCAEKAVIIYPNPLSGNTLWIRKGLPGARLVLADLYGRVWREDLLRQAEAGIDLSEVPAGIYFITISEAGKVLSRQKLVRYQ